MIESTVIEDAQEYLQKWEKVNNPFYPSEMRWDRLRVNEFLSDYKKQFERSDNSDYAVQQASPKLPSPEAISEKVPGISLMYINAILAVIKRLGN